MKKIIIIMLLLAMALAPKETTTNSALAKEWYNPCLNQGVETYEGVHDEFTYNIDDYNFVINETKYIKQVNLSKQNQEKIYDICKEYHIAFTLMLALIEKESSCNPNCKSSTNDYGLCQINSCNFEYLKSQGITDIMNVTQNVTASCMLLEPLFEKYNDVHSVLMAYNMGETGARRCWSKGIYSSKYSRAIVEREQELAKIIDKGAR